MTSHSGTAATSHTFHNLGIAPKFLEILQNLRFSEPTPIQLHAIPPAIEGKDIIGIAQTGTGKTLAFGVPTLQRLVSHKSTTAHTMGSGRALILAPTRELTLQIAETLERFAPALGLKIAVLIGGTSMGPQLSSLRRNPDIIVATPGRLLDHMNQGSINLARVNILVLDEADRMLDMGFWPQIKKIVTAVPKERQTMLFSATLSSEIMTLAKEHMKLPLNIEVAPPGTTVERVSQEFFIVKKEDKIRLLEKVLADYAGSTIIVFTRTKHGATKIMRQVKHMGYTAADIHGNRSLNQRKDALEGFKTGRYRVLIATDIAARGIDVKGIDLVINFDLPSVAADYVHRIGRTARAGAEGSAISFAMPDQRNDMRDIERLIRQSLKVSALPELPPARAPQPHIQEQSRRFGGNRRSHHPSRGGRSQGGGQRRSY